MYEEMITDAIINDQWYYQAPTSSTYASYESPWKKVKNNSYRFYYVRRGIFVKHVRLSLECTSEVEFFSFSIFSPMYWRLVLMDRDRKQNKNLSDAKLLTDTYNAYKIDKTEREIQMLETSIARLTQLQEEQEKFKKAVL
jgi:hypothetical protein